MRLREFPSFDAFVDAAAGLLGDALTRGGGVLVPGGSTPAPVYGFLAEHPVAVSATTRLMLSDERVVPVVSDASNYRMLAPMVQALGMDESQVMRVDAAGTVDAVADRYDHALATFIRAGGRLRLAVLGLGTDGHTASLFPGRAATGDGERYAVPVVRDGGPARVSVTPRLLQQAERVVFWVAGPEKQAIVRDMQDVSARVTAACVVDGLADVDVWYSPQARGDI